MKNNRAPLLSYIKLCASSHRHMWIQTGATARKRLNGVMTSVTLTIDLWHWPFAWTSRLSRVITPENFRMIRWQEHCQKGVTYGRADGRTDGKKCSVAAKNIASKMVRWTPFVLLSAMSLLNVWHWHFLAFFSDISFFCSNPGALTSAVDRVRSCISDNYPIESCGDKSSAWQADIDALSSLCTQGKRLPWMVIPWNACRLTGLLWGESIGHRPVNSPHKGPVIAMFDISLLLAWISQWTSNRVVSDFRQHGVHMLEKVNSLRPSDAYMRQ